MLIKSREFVNIIEEAIFSSIRKSKFFDFRKLQGWPGTGLEATG